MSWASKHIEKLEKGEVVSFRPRGNSMRPLIKSGELCFVQPTTIADVEVGDVVLSKVKGRVYLHKVTGKKGNQIQVSNNRGYVNGWTKTVFGKLVCVAP